MLPNIQGRRSISPTSGISRREAVAGTPVLLPKRDSVAASRQQAQAPILSITTSNIAISEIRTPAESPLKRSMDVVVSCVLGVALSPFLLLVAFLIKLDSRGPVIFRQKRIGKDGATFQLWKFRSMRADVPPYERSPANAADPRLTRVGRVLRRISIDELPQLVNVLKGDMSLVGPRPEMPYIVANYGALERQRLKVKPGITGLWQISSARAMPIHENMEFDLFYIEHQNLSLDFAIMLRTITAVIRGIGAA
jgi:lipopolysaccharide/colanic/teichoic acid biosynthesis glycosyltransferase